MTKTIPGLRVYFDLGVSLRDAPSQGSVLLGDRGRGRLPALLLLSEHLYYPPLITADGVSSSTARHRCYAPRLPPRAPQARPGVSLDHPARVPCARPLLLAAGCWRSGWRRRQQLCPPVPPIQPRRGLSATT